MGLLVKFHIFAVMIYTLCTCNWTSGFILNRPSTISLVNNEYKNVVIAIHDSIPEDSSLIDTLKDTMTKASKYLYTATRRRAFFKEIKILLPSSWSQDALYAAPTTESLTLADVVITDPIRGKRSLPQTRSYSGCGKQGVHVLLTKDFLTLTSADPYFNDPAKYFVHAFAQFRWGVFQEYAEEGEPGFYISPTTGRPEPIKCTIMIRGLVQKNDSANTICYLPSQAQSGHVVASVDNKTGLYQSDCLWRPYPSRQRTKASIMDHQYIKELETFCDDNRTDYMTYHNFEAPSKHNRLCGHRSTWDIITGTDDFRDGNNPPRGLLDSQLEPSFIVTRSSPRKRRAVLMVDHALSKNYGVQQAIGRLKHESSIHDVELRVVDNSKNTIDHEVLGSVENVRTLIGRTSATTSINNFSDRIREVIKMFQMEGKVNQTHLILITNKHPEEVQAMLNYRKHEGTKTSAITLYNGNDCPETLECHMVGKRHGHTVLDRIRQAVAEEIHGPVIVVRDELKLSKTKPTSGYVDVDPALAKHLTFLYHFDDELPYIDLRSPSNVIYNTEDHVCTINYDFKVAKFHFDFTETGRWTFTLRQSAWKPQHVVLTVLSKDTHTVSDDPISIRPSVEYVDGDTKHLLLNVDATQGSSHLIGLDVTARIETPKGKQATLKLLDNGAGVDVSKNDGVYSRTFVFPPLNGSYHVTFYVNGRMNTSERREESFVITYNGDAPVKKLISKTSLGCNLQRVQSGGTVNVQHTNTQSTVDITAPARVVDLEAVRYIPNRNVIMVQWTAPGDDFDHGKPASYELFTGFDIKNIRLFLKYTETGSYDGEGHVTNTSIVAKTSATYTETLLWNVKELAKSYMFSIRAVDENRNVGDISNVAIASVILTV